MAELIQTTEYVVDERDFRPLRNTLEHLTLQLPIGAKADLRTARNHILSNMICGKRMLKHFMNGDVLVPPTGTTFGYFITGPISNIFSLDVVDSSLSSFSSASNPQTQENSPDDDPSTISLTSTSSPPSPSSPSLKKST